MLDNVDILRCCDEKSVRALAGFRDNDKILKLVPNIVKFQLVLRCIKLWAKNRGVSSNVCGYFAGITLAILVARICIDNSQAPENKLIARFFEFYKDYPWSYEYPIKLQEILNDKNQAPGAKVDEARFVTLE